jgi:hypothetical protein
MKTIKFSSEGVSLLIAILAGFLLTMVVLNIFATFFPDPFLSVFGGWDGKIWMYALGLVLGWRIYLFVEHEFVLTRREDRLSWS